MAGRASRFCEAASCLPPIQNQELHQLPLKAIHQKRYCRRIRPGVLTGSFLPRKLSWHDKAIIVGSCVLPFPARSFMSLHSQPVGPVPDDTARVARAVFPRGNFCLRLRDELGTLFSDEDFTALFPTRGQPAEAPWRLLLVSLLPYAENLADRQAAEAVRSRIDWKYLLGLELTDAGFDHTVLSEFRSRLVAGSAEEKILYTLLEKCRERKWLTARGRQRTASTHVLGAIRAMNRLECVGETLRHALNSLAVVAPDWLKENSQPEWVDRYGKRVDDYYLPKNPDERQAYAGLIGTDGHRLLDAVYAPETPPWLAPVPAVEILPSVWVQPFYRTEKEIRWRTEQEGFPPCLLMIGSPYDPQAH
jgi:transposase